MQTIVDRPEVDEGKQSNVTCFNCAEWGTTSLSVSNQNCVSYARLQFMWEGTVLLG
jgi:hypothetical protein